MELKFHDYFKNIYIPFRVFDICKYANNYVDNETIFFFQMEKWEMSLSGENNISFDTFVVYLLESGNKARSLRVG